MSPSVRRLGCAGVVVGASVTLSGIVLLVLVLASSWGSASTAWQTVHWLAGVVLLVVGGGLTVASLQALLSRTPSRPGSSVGDLVSLEQGHQ